MTITSVNGQFSQVSAAIAERFADLINAPAVVVDERGIVVAGSSPGLNGLPFREAGWLPGEAYLRVPVHLHGQFGEVILAEPRNGEVLSLRLAETIIDLVINQTLAARGLPDQHDLKNKLIHDLLHGRATDEADIRREGHILGMDLTRPRAVILIGAAEYILAPVEADSIETSPSRIARRSQQVIEIVVSFFHLPNDMICAYIGDGEVAVLKASAVQDLIVWSDRNRDARAASPSWADLAALKRASEALLTRLRTDTGSCISIGIGRYHPGIQGLARSYQDARTALSIGQRFHGPSGIHSLDGLGVAAFVGISDEQTKLDLARQLLSPLATEPELIKTLHVFFNNDCSPSVTSSELVIHRNTLTLRLNKIHSLMGLDPRRFDDAMLIRLALLLQSAPEPEN